MLFHVRLMRVNAEVGNRKYWTISIRPRVDYSDDKKLANQKANELITQLQSLGHKVEWHTDLDITKEKK